MKQRGVATVVGVVLLGGALWCASGTHADDTLELLSSRSRGVLRAPREAAAIRQALGKTDPWPVFHELCLYGAFEAALATIDVAPPSEQDALRKQLEAHRTAGPQHAALQATWKPLRDARTKRDAARLLRLLDAAVAPASGLARARLLGERAVAYRLTRDEGRAAAAYTEAALAADAIGWARRAVASHRWAARAWRRAPNLPKSLASYRSAVATADRHGRAENAAMILNSATEILSRLARPDELLAASHEVVRRYEALGDVRMVGWTQARLAAVYRRRGRLKDAMAWIERAVENADKSGCPHCRGNAFDERGVVERLLGRFADAVESHEAAFRLNRQTRKLRGMALSRQRQGNAYLRLGEYPKALGSFEQARAFAEAAAEKSPSQPSIVEATRHGEAQVRLALGQLDRAQALFEANLATYEKRSNLPKVAQTLGNLGAIFVRKQRLREAIDVLERSLELKRKIGDRPGTASGLFALGSARLAAGAPEAALALLDEAHQLAQEIGRLRTKVMAMGERARALLVLERHDEAVAQLRAALLASEPLEAPDVRSSLFLLLCQVEGHRGNHEAAVAAGREAVLAVSMLLDGLGGAEEGSRARNQQQDVYRIGLAAAVAANAPKDVAHFLEAGRAGVLLESLKARSLLRDVLLPDALRHELRRARDEEADAAASYAAAHSNGDRRHMRSARTRWAQTKQALQQVVERMHMEAKELAQMTFPRPYDMATIQEVLEAGEALLLYGLAVENFVCLVVRRDSAVIVDLGGNDAIREQVEKLRPDGDPFVEAAILRAVGDALIKPLDLSGVQRLLISPVDLLSSVPFAALIPDLEIAYVGSGTTHHVMLQEDEHEGHHPESHRGTVIGVGAPAYTDPRYPNLPASRQEVEAVADVTLLGPRANETEVVKLVGSRKDWCAVHFACHGVFDRDHPMFSSLVLTPTDNTDGHLTALELFQMRIPSDLVVLSACETAKGRIYLAEGVVGLTRAFTYAGASRVVSSLWKVDDEATRALMERFYELWNPPKDPGLSAAAALRKAQDHVRSQPAWSHPKYWAAWILWGLP